MDVEEQADAIADAGANKIAAAVYAAVGCVFGHFSGEYWVVCLASFLLAAVVHFVYSTVKLARLYKD